MYYYYKMQNAILCQRHKEDSWRIFDTFTTIYTDDVLWLLTTMSRDVIDMEYHTRKGCIWIIDAPRLAEGVVGTWLSHHGNPNIISTNEG